MRMGVDAVGGGAGRGTGQLIRLEWEKHELTQHHTS